MIQSISFIWNKSTSELSQTSYLRFVSMERKVLAGKLSNRVFIENLT